MNISTHELLAGFFLSLVLTLVFEFAFCLLWGVRGKRNFLLIFLINLMTNPLVVGVSYRFGGGYGLKLPLEIAVAAAEAVYLSKFSRGIRRPAVLAVLMNVFSFAAGEIINHIV